MKQHEIYIAIAERFPASTMNVVPFTTREKAAAHVIGRIREYTEGKTWNPEHWTGYGKSGEHRIDTIDGIDFGLDEVVLYNDRVETSAIFGIAVRTMDDPEHAEFGVSESPAESEVDSLARTLWDGMEDNEVQLHVDRDAAIAYLRAMFPEAEVSFYGVDSSYFEYDGGKYFIRLNYDRDENDKLHCGKIIVSDCNNTTEPVTVNRYTKDVKGTLEKFFKKAKSAGDSPDSLAAKLWESMDDADFEVCADTDAAVAYLESVLPRADISKAGEDSIQLNYKGMEYCIILYYLPGPGSGYLQFFNRQSGVVDLEINRDTENPDRLVRKLFEDSPDSPDEPSPDEPSIMDRLDRLDAEIKTLNAEIREIKKAINK